MTNKKPIDILLGLIILVIFFHISIIAKVIPYEIAWGGRLQNDTQMFLFETISIMVNLFLGFILVMKGNYIKFQIKAKAINIILWIFLVLFVINTLGNLFAKSNFEKSFSVLTGIFASLIWTILYSKNLYD